MTTPSKPVAAIVVAAGSGSRLGHELPKALVPLGGIPLVVRAVQAMRDGGAVRVVVVAPAAEFDAFAELFAGRPEVTVVVGGAERDESVRRGLAVVGDSPIVLVHDAARPLVPKQVVAEVIAAVQGGASAVVPVLLVADSVRRVTGAGSVAVRRDELRAVQTPQGFDLDTLRAAHAWVAASGLPVTDDASACEACGVPVVLVPGHREAMKITEPFDLAVAEAVLAGKG
ncbi:2-C-methyl-D-erythritol 4-phosphate cytidylyltransferase [Tessaracoccus sp. OH4464_COT-324]|uniref:2-C-methyl-D-erythritol 4-phosphate cytidylyltransferase n=1 Tax=Tessaracoccus sp. OH4464_COT-324 TaxID=2491059 RepID=UPI000F62EBFB|nr:2-C-methyl-D-erythritol 4-phosphate cytidylyltransferase [Tessaracoccus sp. OH4464_COT-324]RRD46751.1 2-C-methyl-D-erythritol 4-phosphate cytidylyltransferase [Tessaracoccus sp. OH4464_COT-324]